MSALSAGAEEYLALRRALGHDLAEAHRLLPSFIVHLDAAGAKTVTIDAALAWAQDVDADASSAVWPRRMTVARGFAKHMAGRDPDTEIPPIGLLPRRQRWRPPYIYSENDLVSLMAGARMIRFRLPAATHETLIGLLAATGMRVGEALRLERGDIAWDKGVIQIRLSKFGKSRQVPVHTSTLGALDRYAQMRDEMLPGLLTPSFFVSQRRKRLIYAVVQEVFRRLCDEACIGTGAPNRPRIHDLRHTFAVRTLLNWYRGGEDVGVQLPTLSTYLGHRDPRSTYWYLSASPDLLALAAGRLELSQGVIAR